jgi:hypothetical protein
MPLGVLAVKSSIIEIVLIGAVSEDLQKYFGYDVAFARALEKRAEGILARAGS